MKEIISVKKRKESRFKEQRWVEFEIQYKKNEELSKCWIPIEGSIVKKLRGEKLKEHLSERINKPI